MIKHILFLGILFTTLNTSAQYVPRIMSWYNDSVPAKNKLKAASLVVGTNLTVWSIDKFALNAEFAQINLKTIESNFKTGFVWDNDQFLTNLFMHPYHGGLYYNAARSNGFNYWQSIPFTIGGSLMWETCMETEPPSINDLFTTSIGGLALGEITHRLSNSIIDESARGWRRFGLEAAGFFLTPTASLTRFINGDMFRYKPRSYRSSFKKYPLYLQAGVGACLNADETNLFNGIASSTIDLQLDYNEPFGIDQIKPFDYFRMSATLKLFSNQPLISRFNVMALLWGKNYQPFKNHKMLIGIFQNFDYYNSDTIHFDSRKIPYKISAAASAGGGLLYSFANDIQTIKMDMGFHLNAILMGGGLTDYYRFEDRDYSLGSGFGSKAYTQIRFSKVGSFYLGLDFIHLFTWKGYAKSSDEIPLDKSSHVFNSQGDNGNSTLLIINPRMEFYINKQFSYYFDIFSHIRNTKYDYYPDVRYHTFEVKTSLVYKY